MVLRTLEEKVLGSGVQSSAQWLESCSGCESTSWNRGTETNMKAADMDMVSMDVTLDINMNNE
jgi:hypothetical protein